MTDTKHATMEDIRKVYELLERNIEAAAAAKARSYVALEVAYRLAKRVPSDEAVAIFDEVTREAAELYRDEHGIKNTLEEMSLALSGKPISIQ